MNTANWPCSPSRPLSGESERRDVVHFSELDGTERNVYPAFSGRCLISPTCGFWLCFFSFVFVCFKPRTPSCPDRVTLKYENNDWVGKIYLNKSTKLCNILTVGSGLKSEYGLMYSSSCSIPPETPQPTTWRESMTQKLNRERNQKASKQQEQVRKSPWWLTGKKAIKNTQNRRKHIYDFINWLKSFSNTCWGSTCQTLHRAVENMVRVKRWVKEHSNRFRTFPLLHIYIYIRLSVKTDHIADVQIKAQTKSIPAPSWEIHYLKVNSFHIVFPCFLVSTSDRPSSLERHRAAISHQYSSSRYHFCTFPQAPPASAPSHTESWITSSLARKVLSGYSLAVISHDWNLISYDCQLIISSLGFMYQEVVEKAVWKTRERPAVASANSQWFNYTCAASSMERTRIWAQECKPWWLNHNRTDCVCVRAEGYHCLSLNYTSWLPYNSKWHDYGQVILP